MRRVALSVDGMTCTSCSGTIERTIARFPGVFNVTVSLSTNTAIFNMTSDGVDSRVIVDEIESIGFGASVIEETLVATATPAVGTFRTTQLNIEGMTCTSCSGTIERALRALPGVTSAVVSLSTNTATIIYTDGACSTNRLLETVEDVGFGASVVEGASIGIGLSDVEMGPLAPLEQAQRRMLLVIDHPPSGRPVPTDQIISALSCIAGVSDVTLVSEEEGGHIQIRVSIDENVVGPRALVAAIQNVSPGHHLGVTVSSFGGFMLAGRLSSQQATEQRRQWRAVLVACAFTVPILVVTMILPMFPAVAEALDTRVSRGLSADGLLLLLLATPVQFYVGWGFHVKAYKTLRVGSLGMDFLISSGTFAAYFYSLISLVRGIISGDSATSKNVEFFETSAVLITVVLIGKYLEVYTRGITANAIHQLSSLRAQTARLVRESTFSAAPHLQTMVNPLQDRAVSPSSSSSSDGGGDKIIDASLVQKGDILRLVEGESIAADGILQTNALGVDESMMTGESRLVNKKIGDKLYGGSIVMEGSGEMLVTACGDSSALGRIISAVQEAQSSKPPIQEVADRIARYFVPVVACLSLTTFLVWLIAGVSGVIPPAWFNENDGNGSMILFAFMFALSVWVSACPCAFGLATPTAVLVATGVAAKQGILVRKGAALQHAAEVTAAVFDKTGTLTYGKMEVTDFVLLECTKTVAGDDGRVSCGLSCDKIPGIKKHVSTEPGTGTGNGNVVACSCGTTAAVSSVSEKTGCCADDPTTNTAGVMGCVNCSCAMKKSLSTLTLEDGFIDVSLEDILWLLVTAETQSSHPLAKSITEYCRRRLQTLHKHNSSASPTSRSQESFASEVAKRCSIQVIPGQGIHMTVDPSSLEDGEGPRGREASALWRCKSSILVGNLELVTSKGLILSKKAADVANSIRAGGKVVVFVAVNGTLRALVGVSDVVRYEAAAVIASLHEQGIHCYMVTGDEQTTALAIGSALGFPRSHIFSNAKPDEKDAFISKLQRRGAKVVFVGDGTNDSPALARADVGIAMAGGTDIAIESGDMVLCKAHLGSLVTALDLSRRTLRRIKLNYFWALAYNSVLIPISAGILFPSYHFALVPMLAGGAMALSSVSIVLSSLMLMMYKPPQLPSSSSSIATTTVSADATFNVLAARGVDSAEQGFEMTPQSMVSEAVCQCPASIAPLVSPKRTPFQHLMHVILSPFVTRGTANNLYYAAVKRDDEVPSDDWDDDDTMVVGENPIARTGTRTRMSLHAAIQRDIESGGGVDTRSASAVNHPYGNMSEDARTTDLQRFLALPDPDDSASNGGAGAYDGGSAQGKKSRTAYLLSGLWNGGDSSPTRGFRNKEPGDTTAISSSGERLAAGKRSLLQPYGPTGNRNQGSLLMHGTVDARMSDTSVAAGTGSGGSSGCSCGKGNCRCISSCTCSASSLPP